MPSCPLFPSFTPSFSVPSTFTLSLACCPIFNLSFYFFSLSHYRPSSSLCFTPSLEFSPPSHHRLFSLPSHYRSSTFILSFNLFLPFTIVLLSFFHLHAIVPAFSLPPTQSLHPSLPATDGITFRGSLKWKASSSLLCTRYVSRLQGLIAGGVRSFVRTYVRRRSVGGFFLPGPFVRCFSVLWVGSAAVRRRARFLDFVFGKPDRTG